MVDVDVGQQDVVEAFDAEAAQFADQVRDGGERPGVDEEGEPLPPVEPGADELAEAFEGRITSYNVCYTKLLRRPAAAEVDKRLGAAPQSCGPDAPGRTPSRKGGSMHRGDLHCIDLA